MKNLAFPWLPLLCASPQVQASEASLRLLNATPRITRYAAEAAALMLAAQSRLRATIDLEPWAAALPRSRALSPAFEGNR